MAFFHFLDSQNSKIPGRSVACSRFLQRRSVLNLQWRKRCAREVATGERGALLADLVKYSFHQWLTIPSRPYTLPTDWVSKNNRCVLSFETERLTVFLSAQASGQHRFANTKRLITSSLAKPRHLECRALAKALILNKSKPIGSSLRAGPSIETSFKYDLFAESLNAKRSSRPDAT
jgi:hypothetical protein